MIYTTNMLLEKYSNYSNAYNKIQRDCKNGKLVKLMRGLYEDNPSVSPHLCSGYIYGPSYISFDYVLSQSGLIPNMFRISHAPPSGRIKLSNMILHWVPSSIGIFRLRCFRLQQ